jgi:phosphoribosylanthranilate isomerase
MNAQDAPAVRVKICGVTNRDDARMAIALGADALGFNLYPASKRCISLTAESGWICELPPFVSKVAVLVNVPLDEARAVSTHPGIDIVQFHGDEDPGYCAEFARFGRHFIKAIRLVDRAAIAAAGTFSTRHVLLDAHTSGAFGGTGTEANLQLAAELAAAHPALSVILAGGLTPKNVAEAVRLVRPFAVDVATGVEASARRKDEELMRAFIKNARSACPDSLN